MSFHPFRKARRRRILEESPIDDELWDWALREHRIFHRLDEAERARLRELATIFLGEKVFDPVGGIELDGESRVSIAAQAVLPLLGLEEELDWYEDFTTIIVTEREYEVKKREYDEAGVVHEYDDEFAGEAFELGPVALSRADVEASGWGDGYNVVIHEMAHKLDARNGAYDGAPPLRPGMSRAAWRGAFQSAFDDLRARLNSPASRKPRRGRPRKTGSPRLDPYAAESPDEFFAVACEYFFERPELLRSEYPAVYEQLVLFFGRDPTGGRTEA
jgi:Mlc titration factor MtfA (ptsG expression regulator)